MTPAPLVAHSASPGETRALGAALAGVLRPGDLILLAGDLGTGKTTFTQGLARGLGVTDPVTSPTFTLVRAYRCGTGAVRTLLHADLYRLDRLQDVVDLGIAEMVDDESVAVVEWGDVAVSVLGPGALMVRLAAPRPGPDGPGGGDGDRGTVRTAAGAELSPAAGARLSAGPVQEQADEERTVTLEIDGPWSERADVLASALRAWTGA